MRFKKGEISKLILRSILYSGAIIIASTSLTFGIRVVPQLIKHLSWKMKKYKNKERKFYNVFYYLKNKGLIEMEYRNKQLYIHLTREGKQKTKEYQIDDLIIKKPKRWDRKWHILIFDIADKHKIKREALRGKLKEFGLCQLQKSVWIHPYSFEREMDILRSFFGLSKDEVKVVIACEIEDDKKILRYFGL